MRRIPRLLLTPGEPAGIGPDLTVAIAQRPWPVQIVAVADPALLTERAAALHKPLAIEACDPAQPAQPHVPARLPVWAAPLAVPAAPGAPDPRNARPVLDALAQAARACRDGAADALVTGPLHKAAINDAGIAFSGHTEYLAAIVGGAPVMMLVAGNLRVALATTHLPLAAVPGAITRAGIERTLRTLHHDLQLRFGIAAPRILVAGLNPHAGEGGHLGREDIDVIAPAVRALTAEGLNVTGPLPADTLFTPARLAQADAVLAMYHDQGLPVLKYAGFGHAVNVTLGLPILRTSVDHGTALELAASGRADPGSLIAAIELAIELAGRSRVA